MKTPVMNESKQTTVSALAFAPACIALPVSTLRSIFNFWPIPSTDWQSILNYIRFILFYSQWRPMKLYLNFSACALIFTLMPVRDWH